MNILIVDDDAGQRAQLRSKLQAQGHRTLEAADGVDALQVLDHNAVDGIVSDIVMPRLDGYRLCLEVRRREKTRELPFIIYTSTFNSPEDKSLAEAVGADEYLTKPFEIEAVVRAIEQGTGRSSRRRAEPAPELAEAEVMEQYSKRLVVKLEQNSTLLATKVQSLSTAEQHLRLQSVALETTADAVLITDAKGHILWLNAAFQRLTGYSASEAIGRNPRLLRSGRHDRKFYKELWDTLLAGQVWRGGFCNRRKDGTLYYDEHTITPIRAAGGAVTHFVAIMHDVTERMQAEALLREQSNAAALSADVGLALIQSGRLREMLRICAEAVVFHLDAAFARIWTLNTSQNVLELQASAGMYTHLDGSHSRVPVGQLKIGLIAQERKPHLTNDVLNDPRVGDHEWARREGMVSFAGYPLMVADRLVGVMGMFAKRPLSDTVLDSMGNVANKVALGIDRKSTEAERDRLLTQQRMQIDRMPLAYLLLDAEGRVVDWNMMAEQIFGYVKKEVLGMGPPYEEILPASAWPAASQVVERLRTGDMAANAVNENRTKDGRAITCEWFNTPLFDADGAFGGVISLARDITESQRLEREYEESQRRLQRVVSSSPAVIYSLGMEGGRLFATWVSDNLLQMMGFPAQAALGSQWYTDHVHPDDAARVFAEMPEVVTRGHLVQEYRFRHEDGDYRWVRDEKRLVSRPGEPAEIVGSWSDITERKQLEEQFRQAQKMEAIGKLAGGVAHDFNNLLTVIMGFSEMAGGRLRSEDPLRDMLDQIHKAGERASHLTRQLLAFSRKQVLQPDALDLNVLIGGMEKMLRRLIGEDIELTVSAGPGLWLINADPGQIEQVVMNLLVNSRDAMPEGGKIAIETANVDLAIGAADENPEVPPGQYVRLAVSDAGCGMDAATQRRIFEPFFSTKGERGTGLGLATVFGIVKQSGGHIRVYSELALGTSFKVYLPRHVTTARPSLHSRRTLRPRKGNETILLVEDEANVRLLAGMILRENGYTVVEAANAGEALLLCEQAGATVHLLVTDVVMPKMSGRQLAERLTSLRPQMKVLFLSGYTDDAIVHHGVLQAGMPFLNKPFSPDGLARKVRDVLDG